MRQKIMKECPHCKSKNPDGLEKCQWCGKSFNEPDNKPEEILVPAPVGENISTSIEDSNRAGERENSLTPIDELFIKTTKLTFQLFPEAILISSILYICSGLNNLICLLIGPIKPPTGFRAFVTTVIPYLLFFIYLSSWTYVSIIYLVCNQDKKQGIKEIMKTSTEFVFAFILIFLYAGISVAIGGILFFIPGLIVFVWYSLAEFVLVNEKITWHAALMRSKYLVKGYWWHVFGREILLSLIGVPLFLLHDYLQKIFSSVSLYVINIIFTLFGGLFTTIYFYLIYRDLVNVKSQVGAKKEVS
jgi:hypothetical protein